jgi:ribosomal protein S12 methylthiotransferase accessory factor YcaO
VIRVSGAEGGADTGALIELLARTDAGTPIDNPLSIVRAAGGPVSIGSANRPVKFPVVTVATLPAAPGAGSRMFVSDALTPTPGAAVAGGGAVTVPVYYTGVAWFVG